MTEVKDYNDLDESEEPAVMIGDIVRELGELGLVPYEICPGVGHSSILLDSLWKPRFGVSTNSEKESHYIFTIAAMAGWVAEYDVEGRGILLRKSLEGMDDTLGAWSLLLNSTRLVMGEIANP
ncbi:MAG: hypothetical protein ACFFEJ_09295 [Candidatus Thorarchaeota archaeon]